MFSRAVRTSAVLAAAVLLGNDLAHAAVTRTSGPTVLLTDSRRFVKFDTAYDSIHRVYLAVYGTQASGPVNGLFLNESGNAITGLFAVSDGAQQSGWARVIFSPEEGKFLVSYVKIVGNSHHQKIARFLTYASGAASLGPEMILDDWIGDSGTASGMAYSAPAGKFLVTWSHYVGSFPATFVTTITGAGAVSAANNITNPADGQSDPEIACDPNSRRCLVVGGAWGTQAGGRSSFWARFVDDATGAGLGSGSFYVAVWGGLMDPPAIVFNNAAQQFLLGVGMGGVIKGMTASGASQVVNAPFTMLQDTAGTNGVGYGFLSMRYNPAKQTTLATMTAWIGWAAVQEFDGSGGKVAGGFDLIPDTPENSALPYDTANQFTVPAANAVTSQFLVLENHYFLRLRSSVYSGAAVTSCSGALSVASANAAGSGDGGTVNVSIGSSCDWTAVSNASWINVSGGASGTGSGTVTFGVAANPSSSPRSGTITIAGLTFTVNQFGVPCTSSITPGSISISAPAANGTISVTTSASQCAWSAVSGSPFISFTNGSGRAGSGSLAFTIGTNLSTLSRSGSASVAGKAFLVTQAGAAVDSAKLARENARADFNGDGYNDLLWQDSVSGARAIWFLQGNSSNKSAAYLNPGVVDLDWEMVGTGDFNGDGRPDIVWHNRVSGMLYLWYMNGVNRIGDGYFSLRGIPDPRWKVVGVGDFNGDGHPDILWQHDTLGWIAAWLFNDRGFIGGVDLNPNQVDVPWKIVGVADFDGDGQPDLLWRNVNNGALGVWLMNGTTRTAFVALSPDMVDDLEWKIVSVLDVNGDQTPDIVWRHASRGWVAVWYMNGTNRLSVETFPVAVENSWKIAGPK